MSRDLPEAPVSHRPGLVHARVPSLGNELLPGLLPSLDPIEPLCLAGCRRAHLRSPFPTIRGFIFPAHRAETLAFHRNSIKHHRVSRLKLDECHGIVIACSRSVLAIAFGGLHEVNPIVPIRSVEIRHDVRGAVDLIMGISCATAGLLAGVVGLGSYALLNIPASLQVVPLIVVAMRPRWQSAPATR
jgi:hypothetical protein